MLQEFGVDIKLESRISREFIDLDKTLSRPNSSTPTANGTGRFSYDSPSSKEPALHSHSSVNSDSKFNEVVHSWAQNLLDDKSIETNEEII